MSSFSEKTVFFYGIYLEGPFNGQEESYLKLKSIFNDIFSKKAVHNGTNNALVLEKEPRQVTLDILEDTDDFLFGRLGRVRENNEMQFRNLKTLSCEDILDPLSLDIKGIEAITYFLIDYKKGILSIIKGQHAPHQTYLNNIINHYNPNFTMKLKPIINTDVVRTILNGDYIREIVYDMAIPSPEMLDKIPGLSENQVMGLRTGDGNKISISISSETKRKPILKFKNDIEKSINEFLDRRDLFKNVRFKTSIEGKSPEFYNLIDSAFTSKVDIDSEIKNDRRKQEIEFNKKLKQAYNSKKRDLLVCCDRFL